jgi:DNA-binding transcriptional MerR regulator
MRDPARHRQPAHDGEAAQSRADVAEAERRFSIGELAAELKVTTRAIRFYEARGLLAPDRKGVARAYTRRDRARLLLILRGKNLGFKLEDIKAYLELYDADPTGLAQLRLLETKIERHIEKLNRKRADLDRTLKELEEIRSTVARQLAARPARG